MDIALARTFLEVAEVGSFLGAAERLHLSQSAVSTRIRALEVELGKPLFRRQHDGVELTAAGELFKRYAMTMVAAWQQAKLHLQVAPNFRAVVALGGEYNISDQLLADWLVHMRSEYPDIAVRADIATSAELARRLGDGTLDIIVTYKPQLRPGLTAERLFDDRLVTVYRESGIDGGAQQHVYVDWGPELHAAQSAFYDDGLSPTIYTTNAQLGLRSVLQHGGQALLPLRLVRPHLDGGQLRRVAGAPEHEHEVYLVYSKDNPLTDVFSAVALLRDFADESL